MAFVTNGTGGCTAIGNAIAAIYGLHYCPGYNCALAEKKAREEAEKAAFEAKIKARRQSTVKAPS